MSESKVYMFPDGDYHRGSNCDAALWATLANRQNDNGMNSMWPMMAMNGGMMGGMGQMWNNPLT